MGCNLHCSRSGFPFSSGFPWLISLRCLDVRVRRCLDVRVGRCLEARVRRCLDVRVRRCLEARVRRCLDVRVRRCLDVRVRRCLDVRVRRCLEARARRCLDVRVRRCLNVCAWRYDESQAQPTRSHGSPENQKHHPVCAGTSSPGWPLENGHIFHEVMHIYLYVLTKVSFWKLRLTKGFSSDEVWHWCTRTSGLGSGFSRDFVKGFLDRFFYFSKGPPPQKHIL